MTSSVLPTVFSPCHTISEAMTKNKSVREILIKYFNSVINEVDNPEDQALAQIRELVEGLKKEAKKEEETWEMYDYWRGYKQALDRVIEEIER